MGDVRRYLAGLLNRYEAGEIDETHLKAAAYVSNILTSCIKGSDFEERIQKAAAYVSNILTSCIKGSDFEERIQKIEQTLTGDENATQLKRAS